jgi:signal peptidase I
MRHRNWMLITAVLIGGGIGLFARDAGLRPIHVTSGSMAPAVEKSDWIVVGPVGNRGPRRGDIVEFSFPIGTPGRAIKRVVAVAGDRVEFTDHTLTVNGRTRPIDGTPRPSLDDSLTVPDNSVFLLGDHAAVSIDSRAFGPVPLDAVVARERLVLPAWSTLAAIALATLVATAVAALTIRRPRAHRRRQPTCVSP